MHPLTTDRSKAALSVLNKPLVLRSVQYLARFGIHEVVINRHKHADSIAVALLGQTPPDTTIILDHFGGPLGIGPYAGRRAEVFGVWKTAIRALADCPNVVVKLGGLVMPLNGFDFHKRTAPVTSVELAEATRAWYLHAIDCFGPARCMFESNFPVDSWAADYSTTWNAFKRITATASAADKAALYAGTAARIYRLGDIDLAVAPSP